MKNLTKLLMLIILWALVPQMSHAQCPLAGTLYGTAAAPTTCTPAYATPTCHYTSSASGDHAAFTALVAGSTYKITTAATAGSQVPNTDELTVYLSTNTTTGSHVAYGTGGTVTFTPAVSGTYVLVINKSGAACGTAESTCRYPSIQCISCAGPGAPTCPTLSAPTNNATGISTLPTLTWSAATNAASYDVYLDADPTCAITPTTLLATVTTTSYTLVTPLSPTTSYRWMVVPKDCSGTAPASCTPFCFTTSTAPPANDNCTGTNGTPVALTPQANAAACSSPVSATTVGATQSSTNCSSTATNDDVWFVFTAGATTQTVRFENVVAVTGTVASMGMDLYTTCGGTNTNCNTAITLTSGAGQANLTGLTAGTQYFLRVWTTGTSNSATFNICIINPPPPPTNDDPCGAVSLTPGSGGACSFATYTNASATSTTGPPAPGCASFLGGDVWFSVVVPASGALIINTSVVGTLSDGGMALYSSSDNTCTGTFTLIECDDDDSPNGSMPFISRSGLTPGSTVFVRFWEYSNDNNGFFGICVTEPSSNDNCAGATSLSVSPSNTCTTLLSGQSTVYATQSVAGCSGTADDDIWYSFVATDATHVITLSGVTPTTTMVTQVYSGTCGSLTSLACSTTNTTSVSGLTIGQTYYIRVHTSGLSGTYATFDICITVPPAMTYVSSTTTQVTGSSGAGSVDQQTIRIDVTVINLGAPLSVTSFNLNTNGTSVPADITNAKIYYTGTSTTFSTSNLFGSLATPSGAFTINGSQVLTGGTSNTVNYFWLAYDLACGATGPNLDGECNSLVIGGGSQTPTVQAPASSRTITALTSFTTAANGNWSSPSTWLCGVPPSGTTVPIVINHNVSLDATVDFNSNLTINSGRTLTIAANKLTVGPTGGGNRTMTVNGVLTLSGGTLEVNGNVILSSNSTFNMSGGTFLIDPNSGVSGTSVASGTAVFAVGTTTTAVTSNVTGGTIIFNDPPFAGGGLTLVNNTNTSGFWNNTVEFGGTTGTNATTATNGFQVDCYVNSGRLKLGNVTVNGGDVSRRVTDITFGINVANDLTVNAGSELRISTSLSTFGGNITNNGTITTTGTYALATTVTGATTATATANPQSITGSGVWRNAATSPTANFSSLTINNSSGTPISIPSNMISGVGTGTVSGSLTLTSGRLDVGSTPLILGISTTTVGTLNPATPTSSSYIIGEFRRWVGSTTGNRFFPVGTTATARFAQINFTTAQTTGGVLGAQFIGLDPGTTGLPMTWGGISVEAVSPSGYWQIDRLSGSGGTYTGTFDCTGFTKVGGAAITDLANVRMIRRPNGGSWTAATGAAAAPTNLNAVALTGQTAFSEFGLGGTFGALPVELKSFTGRALKSSNQLEWVTSTEQNVREHVIERSLDGYNNWTIVGSTPGKGDSREEQFYSLEDKAPLAKAFYRLRTVDYDGKEDLSGIISLTRLNNAFGVVSAYPNPATESIHIDVNSLEEGMVVANIMDMTGRLIQQQQINVEKGVNTMTINLHQLGAGTYYISLQNEKEVTSPVRFVKQ